MIWLKETFPILWSPQFWGAFFTIGFQYLKTKGWVGEAESNALSAVIGAWTAIGVTLKAAKKIGGTVTANIETVEKVSVTNPPKE